MKGMVEVAVDHGARCKAVSLGNYDGLAIGLVDKRAAELAVRVEETEAVAGMEFELRVERDSVAVDSCDRTDFFADHLGRGVAADRAGASVEEITCEPAVEDLVEVGRERNRQCAR